MSQGFNWDPLGKGVFDAEDRIQPLNCKKGEVANHIISVGDPNRAKLMSESLDKDTPVIVRQSNMIFCTYTGKYKGTPVSIIATGMGFAMAELMVVQARAVVEGPMTIVRFGTCGSLHADVPIGCFAIADRAYFVRQDFEKEGFPFEFAKESIPFNHELHLKVLEEFKKLTDYRTVVGPDTSADTFYPSQGRLDDNFVMENEKVIPTLLAQDKDALSFEMESYLLAFLAHKFPEAQMKTAAVCLTLAQRTSGNFLDNARKMAMEKAACTALLEILSKC
ncbi:Phosphorylase family protein [Trichomonas vaginalis G3]|uniref:Phosphorylase family protein n=1 Tax=Trichomonas vaginalis (strain ATCC PRA-98 / G3) TaxID=412133 RepID=A2E6V5_TRIV3|nr:uridine phosphorylase protein [Trichomonas vaginalis G3]EAY11591.1 Phosphorylase family protein [Trichomonas vaginalis G3]KAI5516526.1 uridine phosphorylase protein [Trichomonas vaginalis G3]|eukprot:XP_001323814.1 Phosphorylase family protein [Trichomonas vaginalis G3]